LDILSCFVKDELTIELRVHFWALYSVPLIYVSVFVPVPYCIDDDSFVIELEVQLCFSFSTFLWLFEVFSGSIHILGLFVPFL